MIFSTEKMKLDQVFSWYRARASQFFIRIPIFFISP